MNILEPVDLVKEVEGRYSIHYGEEADRSDKTKRAPRQAVPRSTSMASINVLITINIKGEQFGIDDLFAYYVDRPTRLCIRLRTGREHF